MRNMKSLKRFILGTACVSALALTGCIDEADVTYYGTDDQLSSSSKATEALLWAMPAFTNNYKTVDGGDYDWGYGSIMHIRDVMTEEMTVVESGYDHYSAWEHNQYIGPNYLSTQFIWYYFWKQVQTTNNLIGAIDPESASETQLGYLGTAYAFRAFTYLDMARMFEFLENDGTSNITTEGNDVLHLTVPIVTEDVTEESSRNNPRATREEMYNFILEDLNKAEEYLANFVRPTKTLPDLAVVYGLKARLYMWVEDYANAKQYARKAIDESGATPTTREQWLSTTSGFNDISISSWMFGSTMRKEDEVVQSGIINWTSWMSNEASYGYAAAGPMTMVDVSFYNRIDDTDFRKLSWKAPAGSALDGQNTYCDPEAGAALPDYASLKFRPGQGNTSDFNVGSACSYPMMRVEEMYFIEAEAAAQQNPAEGVNLLNSFMQSYRDDSYRCLKSSKEDVVEEIVFQKRVELWGEGQSFFDVKRLNMPVTRGYAGTNHQEVARFNTTTRPAWMNICIVLNEEDNNQALIGFGNPDPSDVYPTWSE